MPTNDFAMNGAAVLVEYPDRLETPPRRAAWGTVLRQAEGTSNWFHFAPTTPVNGADESSYQLWLHRVTLRAELDGARIEDVHIRAGERLIWNLNDRTRLPIASPEVHEHFPEERSGFIDLFRDNPDRFVGYGGLVLALRVSFEGRPGQIIFRDARFQFYVWG